MESKEMNMQEINQEIVNVDNGQTEQEFENDMSCHEEDVYDFDPREFNPVPTPPEILKKKEMLKQIFNIDEYDDLGDRIQGLMSVYIFMSSHAVAPDEPVMRPLNFTEIQGLASLREIIDILNFDC